VDTHSKQLEGVIDIRLSDTAQRTLNYLRDRFRAMEKGFAGQRAAAAKTTRQMTSAAQAQQQMAQAAGRQHAQAMGQVQQWGKQVGRTLQAGRAMFRFVSSAATKLLRVYWIFVSIFYALRNILQVYVDLFNTILAQVTALIALFGKFTAVVIQSASEMETLGARMNVMFKEMAPQMMRWIMEEAIGLPYTWVEIGEGVTRAMVMGAKKFSTMRAVVRVAEDMGIAFQQPLERAVHAIMQGAVGRFRSLIETFGFRPELAVRYGAVPLQRGRGVAGGMENFSRNLQAILRMIEDRVGGAARAMSGTWKAMVEDAKDLWDRVVYDIRSDVMNPLKRVLVTLRELFLPRAGREGVAPWVDELTETVRQLWSVVDDISIHITKSLPKLLAAGLAFFKWVTDWATKAYNRLDGFEGIVERLYTFVRKWLPMVVHALAPIAAAMIHVGAWIAAQAKGIVVRSEKAMLKKRFKEEYDVIIDQMDIVWPGHERPWDFKAVEEVQRRYREELRAIEERADKRYWEMREWEKRGFEALDEIREAVDAFARGGKGQWPSWAQKLVEKFEEAKRWMPPVPDFDELVSKHAEAMSFGADQTRDAIEEGFDTGGRKIKNMFDVAKFMGYTAMAARYGYGTQEAMALAQQRVLEEMAVRSGKRGAQVTPWPWTRRAAPTTTVVYGPVSGVAPVAPAPWLGARGGLTFTRREQMGPSPVDAQGIWNRIVYETRKKDLTHRILSFIGRPTLFFKDWLVSRAGPSIGIDIKVEATEGIKATVTDVRVDEEQQASLAWHRG